MMIFNKALENNKSNTFDHFYIPKNESYANTNFSLTSLTSTLDLTPTLDQSLTPISNAILFQNT